MGYVLDRIRRANGRTTGAGLPGRGEGGFTLLEVLVALAILGISVTVIFQLFSANMRAIRGSEDYISAAVTAQTKMRQVLDDDKLAEKSWSETTVDGYRVDVVVAETLKDRTKDLEVQLLEVILTVYWTKNSKTKTMTARGMKMIPRGEIIAAGTASTKKSSTGTTVKK
jgi:general secretion pathway protein I